MMCSKIEDGGQCLLFYLLKIVAIGWWTTCFIFCLQVGFCITALIYDLRTKQSTDTEFPGELYQTELYCDALRCMVFGFCAIEGNKSFRSRG